MTVQSMREVDFLYVVPVQKNMKNPADFAMSFPTDQTKLGKHEEGLNIFENQGHV
jgi:hypothetical protein